MKRTSTAIALVMAVSAAPALAQVQWTFADLDSDGNLELSEREFEQVSRDAFADFDQDRDEVLNEEEFGLFDDRYGVGDVFGDWDADTDGGITSAEFGEGLYGAYDRNDDAVLDEQEFAQARSVDPTTTGTATTTGAAAAATDVSRIGNAEVVSLDEWEYGNLYQNGFSADEFIDEIAVYGEGGEEIGDVEDLLIGTDGKVVAVIAEVGGFWDIGDTHVSIPWSEVRMGDAGDGIVVPLTEENVGEYGVYDSEFLTRGEAAASVIGQVDDATAQSRMWRVSELIGTYARTQDGDAYRNYGYVNDVILRDGQVAAVVVQPDRGYGVTGRFAYPYDGTRWNPGGAYYDMPYASEEAAGLDRFDYDELNEGG